MWDLLHNQFGEEMRAQYENSKGSVKGVDFDHIRVIKEIPEALCMQAFEAEEDVELVNLTDEIIRK